jgi:hypothetical protein
MSIRTDILAHPIGGIGDSLKLELRTVRHGALVTYYAYRVGKSTSNGSDTLLDGQVDSSGSYYGVNGNHLVMSKSEPGVRNISTTSSLATS